MLFQDLIKRIKVDKDDDYYSDSEVILDKISKNFNYQRAYIDKMTQAPLVNEVQEPTYSPNIEGVRNLYKQQLGTANRETTNLDEYFPFLAESEYIQNLEPVKQRPGLYELMYLMGLQESTGGRATRNLFGAKPGGDVAEFENLKQAIDYQLSENVFGGGVGDKLNILKNTGPVTEEEIRQLMQSYNPEMVYLEWLIENYNELINEK